MHTIFVLRLRTETTANTDTNPCPTHCKNIDNSTQGGDRNN